MKEILILPTLCLLILTIISSISSTPSSGESLRNYHHDVFYPSSKNYLLAPFTIRYNLKKSGFQSAPPGIPELGFFQTTKDPPLFHLFTPNTFDQRPESVGQIEEYKKALDEEAEEKRKENEIPSTFGHSLEGYNGPIKSYVAVKSDTYDYKYKI